MWSKQSYSFTKQGTDVFTIESHVLDTIDISQAQFVTLPEDETSDLITSQFLLWGRLKYNCRSLICSLSVPRTQPERTVHPAGCSFQIS